MKKVLSCWIFEYSSLRYKLLRWLIEILLNNTSGKIKSGLLARVRFIDDRQPPIIIPESALNGDSKNNLKVFILNSLRYFS